VKNSNRKREEVQSSGKEERTKIEELGAITDSSMKEWEANA
jgi:hypothetical protein